jgi:DNA-binding CsgD family transcriptional regulator
MSTGQHVDALGPLVQAAHSRAAPLLEDRAPPAPLTELGGPLDVHRDVAGHLARALTVVGAGDDGRGWEAVAELHRLARRVLDDGLVARLRALERVQEAVGRLEELGPVSEIVERASAEAAAATGLERVLLSRIEAGALVAEALHVDGDPGGATATLARLREEHVVLDYPLIEGEVLRRRRPLLVTDAEGDPRGRQALAHVLRWRDFVTAPILLEGRIAGFLHGDRTRTGAPVTALDRDALWTFAQGFARVYERAVLRRRLRAQRQEMRQVASWADARTSELSDRAIDLAAEREPGGGEEHGPAAGSAESRLRELLTRRELDVLELMVRGETNAGIARALVVSEGTIKFHVKNILRKLHAANRAEATSRYLRLTLRRTAQ